MAQEWAIRHVVQKSKKFIKYHNRSTNGSPSATHAINVTIQKTASVYGCVQLSVSMGHHHHQQLATYGRSKGPLFIRAHTYTPNIMQTIRPVCPSVDVVLIVVSVCVCVCSVRATGAVTTNQCNSPYNRISLTPHKLKNREKKKKYGRDNIHLHHSLSYSPLTIQRNHFV